MNVYEQINNERRRTRRNNLKITIIVKLLKTKVCRNVHSSYLCLSRSPNKRQLCSLNFDLRQEACFEVIMKYCRAVYLVPF